MNQLTTGRFIAQKRKEKILRRNNWQRNLAFQTKPSQNGKQENVCPITVS